MKKQEAVELVYDLMEASLNYRPASITVRDGGKISPTRKEFDIAMTILIELTRGAVSQDDLEQALLLQCGKKTGR
jgi:hypothetical protein